MSDSDKRPPGFGAYRDPSKKNPVIAESKAVPSSAARTMTDGLHEEMKKDVDDIKETTIKAKGYEEVLAEAEISVATARAIVDDLLIKGYYEEDIQITKSTYVTFRTRTHADYRRYLRALEVLNPRFIDEQNEIQVRYFLAASLAGFKGRAFEHAKANTSESEQEVLFDKRLDWVSGQPDTLVTLLAVKLSKFDRTVKIVMSEGVVENF